MSFQGDGVAEHESWREGAGLTKKIQQYVWNCGSALNMQLLLKKKKFSLTTSQERKKRKFDSGCIAERPGHQVGLGGEPFITGFTEREKGEDGNTRERMWVKVKYKKEKESAREAEWEIEWRGKDPRRYSTYFNHKSICGKYVFALSRWRSLDWIQ